jgi:hypothetical protein
MTETLQLEATPGRDYLSRSAQIDKGAVGNQQETVTKIAVIDPNATDNVNALRCTSTRIEDGPDGYTEDDTASAMGSEILASGEGGLQNIMASGDAGQHTTQVNKTLPIAGTTSLSGYGTLTSAPRKATSSRSYKRAHRVQQTFYQALGNGQSIAGNHTSMLGTPAAAAAETTTMSTSRKRTGRDCT